MVVEVIHKQLAKSEGHLQSANVVTEVIQDPRNPETLGSIHYHPVLSSPDHLVLFFPDLLNHHILDDILCAKQVVSSYNSMNAW
jgi:hypothetical protein